MFTSFFYEDSGAETCKRFLSSSSRKEEVAIVVDPPFGGLAKVLATGLNSLWQMAGKGYIVYPAPYRFYPIVENGESFSLEMINSVEMDDKHCGCAYKSV